MNIEFHTPFKKVSEKLINKARKEIMEMVHLNKKISRAEVFLREEENANYSDNKVCEIRLSIYGDNLFVHTRAENFEKAVKLAINDLMKIVKQQVSKQKETPDKITSTVKV